MTAGGDGWRKWLLITLLVVVAILLIPLGWMLCSMLFGGGMMAGMAGMGGEMGGEMGGGMMGGMHWAGLLGIALLVLLLVALILLLVRGLAGGSRRPTSDHTRSRGDRQ